MTATTRPTLTPADRARRRTSATNRGKWLEAVIASSQGDSLGPVVRLDKFDPPIVFRKGGGAGVGRGPVDFIGEFVATGRAIHLDAKESRDANAFELGYCLKPHQRDWLLRHGDAKAVAGLVVACHARERFLWLDWRHLVRMRDAVPWGDPDWIDIGHAKGIVQFRRLGELIQQQLNPTGRK